MPRDYSTPILDGEGETDYCRYLGLHRHLLTPGTRVNLDELLFKTVHQVTELWLQLAWHAAVEAIQQIHARELLSAERLLRRTSLAITLITNDLEMLTHLTPSAFQELRPALGHGSGAESPGWAALTRSGRDLDRAFTALLGACHIDLADTYRSSPDTALYRLAEAILDFDQRVALWRTWHYENAVRILGDGAVGTKGMPIEYLSRRLTHRFVPVVWRVRSELTRTGPNGYPQS